MLIKFKEKEWHSDEYFTGDFVFNAQQKQNNVHLRQDIVCGVDQTSLFLLT